MAKINYIDMIVNNHPTVRCSSLDPFDYSQIVWDNGDPLPSQTTLETEYLSFAIDHKQQCVNTFRDNWLTTAGFYFESNMYDSDTLGKANVTGAITSILCGFTLPSTFTWRSKDNQNIPMTGEQLTGLGLSMSAYISTIFGWSWELKSIISTMTSIDVIEAFDIAAHWPTNNFDGTGPGLTTNASIAAIMASLS